MTETHDALEVLQSGPAAALLARSPSRPRHELRTKHLHDYLPWQDQTAGLRKSTFSHQTLLLCPFTKPLECKTDAGSWCARS